jgi:DNA polymerase-3 subunit beta
MPILSNILFIVEQEQVTLVASDLELTAISKVKANVVSTGRTTINGRLFADIVRELPDGEVLVKLQPGERVEFHSQVSDSTLKLIGHSAMEYPNIPLERSGLGSNLPAKQFLDMINKTLYAVSQDETRMNINGVCLSTINIDGSKALQMVATDGHRLSRIIKKIEGLDLEKEITIPKKGLLEIKKLLDLEKQESVKVAVQDQNLYISNEQAQISIRLIEASFPDYEQVFPKNKGQSLVLLKDNLEHALKRVSLMVSDKNKAVKIDVIKDILQISSYSAELGEAKEQLPVEVFGDQEDLSVGFNARFMLDFANSLSENQEVVFEIHGTEGPAKLYPKQDESYVAIIMPMRIS